MYHIKSRAGALSQRWCDADEKWSVATSLETVSFYMLTAKEPAVLVMSLMAATFTAFVHLQVADKLRKAKTKTKKNIYEGVEILLDSLPLNGHVHIHTHTHTNTSNIIYKYQRER